MQVPRHRILSLGVREEIGLSAFRVSLDASDALGDVDEVKIIILPSGSASCRMRSRTYPCSAPGSARCTMRPSNSSRSCHGPDKSLVSLISEHSFRTMRTRAGCLKSSPSTHGVSFVSGGRCPCLILGKRHPPPVVLLSRPDSNMTGVCRARQCSSYVQELRCLGHHGGRMGVRDDLPERVVRTNGHFNRGCD